MYPLPLIDNHLLVDNSFLSELQTCPYSLWMNRIQKRVLAANRPGMTFGSIGHKVLEMRYRQLGSSFPDVSFEEQQIDYIHQVYNDPEKPLGFEEDDWRTQNWAVEMFVKRYNARYQIEPFNILFDGKQKPLVEVSFIVPLMSFKMKDGRIIQVMHIGRIDLVVETSGNIFPVDHKNLQMLGENVLKEGRTSPQFTGYVRGFYKSTGILPIGYIINYIRTKAAPVKPRGGLDQWWLESFYRQTEFVTPNQIVEWEQNACEQVEEFFWRYENDRFTQHKKSCVTKYGPCQYFEVCTLPRKQHSEMLSSTQFEDNNWSPLDHN
jgi:hypothetical protein